MAQSNLTDAKKAKNDEFYTQYEDIQREVNAYLEYNPDVFRGKTVLLPCDDPEWSNFTKFFAQNFEKFGLKKLISTSYAYESKTTKGDFQISIFEQVSPEFDPAKTRTKGKIFTLTRDGKKAKKINIDDLKWHYLEGDGDFRSDEVKALRDEADIIVTNPPFSLFREFLAWIMEADKKFLIIGNQNAITYKEVFQLIKENRIWLGCCCGDMAFTVPSHYEARETRFWIDANGQKWRSLGNICWFTNFDHGRRHLPLSLMTMTDNLKFSKHKEIREHGYQRYDNYDAVEVPFVDALPCDYDGVMGVPVTFLEKYCPEQFEIIGLDRYTVPKQYLVGGRVAINSKPCYARILIKRRK